MRAAWRQYHSFDSTVRLLLLNQLTINLGFYMLMPYLASHLSTDLGLAAGLVGLILGVRNLSQQGMFVVGGALADRLGYRTMIITGCALRTVGFAILGFADTMPALLAASAATGLAGAFFNPAVRAYLAHATADRRVEAFALFNVFYQAGILIGPLIGIVLTAVTFQLTCAVAAAVFAALTVAQIRLLPSENTRPAQLPPAARGGWRGVVTNRRFLLFSAAMVGSYVLSFQIYLALPLQLHRVLGGTQAATVATGTMFAVSALVTIGAQIHLTDWCRRRWPPGRCLTAGLALMGAAYAPLILVTDAGPAATLAAVMTTTALLALGSAMAYPFEMDTIVTLSGGHRVATHYGLFQTIAGIGILAGNAGIGDLLGRTDRLTPWLVLLGIGAAATVAVHQLDRAGQLHPQDATVAQRV